MINLLPSSTRKDMLYARKNSYLRKWLAYLFATLIGAALIIFAGMFYLAQTSKNLQKQAASAKQSLQDQKIDETQKEVEQISNNVKLTIQVLSREVLFSKLLTQLGAALPANTTLQQLQIDKIQGGITIIARAKDIDSATQVQLNLQDPTNKIFEKADIENITCNPDPENEYACVVQIRALFAKDNPFLFISPTKTGSVKQ